MTSKRLLVAAALMVVVWVAGYTVLAQSPTEPQMIRFDVAENGTRYVADDAPVLEDGLPDYGNPFITQGYIYPEGTIEENNGVLPDGSPEFPDLVMGTWVCRGWIFGVDGVHTTRGPIVISTQVYDLGDSSGETTFISEGFEIIDLNLPVLRALTGGTGEYAGARGEVSQTLLGFNPSNGVNLRFEVRTQ
jgi:hypothetical protein